MVKGRFRHTEVADTTIDINRLWRGMRLHRPGHPQIGTRARVTYDAQSSLCLKLCRLWPRGFGVFSLQTFGNQASSSPLRVQLSLHAYNVALTSTPTSTLSRRRWWCVLVVLTSLLCSTAPLCCYPFLARAASSSPTHIIASSTISALSHISASFQSNTSPSPSALFGGAQRKPA